MPNLSDDQLHTPMEGTFQSLLFLEQDLQKQVDALKAKLPALNSKTQTSLKVLDNRGPQSPSRCIWPLNYWKNATKSSISGVLLEDLTVRKGEDQNEELEVDNSEASPTNGKFNVFWDTDNLSPSQVAAIKSKNSNVKVALSLGGDSVGGGSAYFKPSSVNSWLSNAVSSLTDIIQEYNLDGIDIDYEHFQTDPDTFAQCIGQLISTLKKNGVISFASIAPYDDDQVQSHYMALWKSYGHLIDYVNFQFYAYDEGTTVSQFLNYFETQRSNYKGGKILPSFLSAGSGGLSPENGFFTACSKLKSEGNLHGIFVWCADDSKALGFKYEKQSQSLLAISH
ncbi:chitinase 2-like [Olea europaea subsp. europaea]|uniref:Chitinase 2-like n=1 Tax=Olea europaea subsp. europaea TaxID=158383 RepID=A0A8S0V1C1_OLEEU|nr:chitinase 2-like [Olea europaea subsp. europaea]